jgi:heat shock protein HtpX
MVEEARVQRGHVDFNGFGDEGLGLVLVVCDRVGFGVSIVGLGILRYGELSICGCGQGIAPRGNALREGPATGRRDDAAILVSDGLLRRLDWRELAAVLAHEIAHIAHDDIRVMALAELVSRITAALSLAGQLLLLLVLPALVLGMDGLPWFPILILLAAPTLSALVQLAVSRSREYEADRGAVELSGDPVALASALVKLEQTGSASREQLLLPGRRLPEPSLLRTHPPTAERVERLRDLASAHATGFSSGSPLRLPLAETSGWAGSPPRQPPRRHWTGLWY